MADIFDIAGRINSTSQEKVVTTADQIKDETQNKKQNVINADVARHETEIHGTGGIDSRLTDVEQIEQIVIDGGDAQIATGADFTNPDATKRAKVPTVGAIVDGLNDGVYDVSKRNPIAGPNSDGKFTLDYILDNANTLIPTGWRHGGMTISFVHTSDNKYVQARCMAQSFTTDVTQWQGVDDEPSLGSKNLINSNAVAYKLLKIFSEELNISPVDNYRWNSTTNEGTYSSTNKYYKINVTGADTVVIYNIMASLDPNIHGYSIYGDGTLITTSNNWSAVEKITIDLTIDTYQGYSKIEIYVNQLKTSESKAVVSKKDSLENITIKLIAQDLTTEQKTQALANLGLPPSVDNEPEFNSENLVKSSGVANVNGAYISTFEWLYLITDNDRKVVFGIKENGDVEWVSGVPTPIMKELLKKVDKEPNKSLVDDCYHQEEALEDVFVLLDKDNREILRVNDAGKIFTTLFKAKTIECEKLKVGYATLNIETNDVGISDSIFKNDIDTLEEEHIEIPVFENTDEPYLISINNQEQFDIIDTLINSAIAEEHNTILIMLNTDVEFSENHLDFTNSNYPNAGSTNIIINGLNHRVTPKGNTYSKESQNVSYIGNKYVVPCLEDYAYEKLYLDGERELKTEEDIKITPEAVIDTGDIIEEEGVPSSRKERHIYKIKLLPEDYNTDATHISVSSRFMTNCGQITKVENGYAFFWIPYVAKYNNMAPTGISGDSDYIGLNPRYALINSSKCEIYIKDGYLYANNSIKEVKICNSYSFCTIDTFKSVEISNISFIGNNYIIPKVWPEYKGQPSEGDADYISALICIKRDISAIGYEYVRIHDNIFRNMKGHCIGIHCNSGNVKIDHNNFEHIYRWGIYSKLGSANNYIVFNHFNDSNVLRSNYAPIYLMGNNELVSHNEIVDYISYGISGGTIHEGEELSRSGIIEYNTLYNTKEKLMQARTLGMCETAAIYNYFAASKLIIRHNIIYNSMGIHNNIGIMGDGYSPNMKIYRNVVLNNVWNFSGPQKSNSSYSILTSDNGKLSQTKANGRNNFVAENFIVFYASVNNSSYRNNKKGRNFILCFNNSAKEDLRNTDISINFEKDVNICNCTFLDGIICVPSIYRNYLINYMSDYIRNMFNFNRI